MVDAIRTPNLPTGTLIEIIGHADAGGGNKNLVRMDMATFVATFITPSLVAGPFSAIADFLSTGTVTDGSHNKLLVLPADGTQITVAIDAAANLRSDYQVKLLNPAYKSDGTPNLRRHRIIAQYEDFFLSPGHTVEFTKHGGYVLRKDPPVRWKKAGLTLYANSAATATTYDGMVAGTTSAKKTLKACVDTILNDMDNMGSSPLIVPVGTFSESIALSGVLATGTQIQIEAVSPSTCTWQSGASTYCALVGDGAIITVHNLDFTRGTAANVALLAPHQYSVIDIGDPNVSGTDSGCSFADPGTVGSAVAADRGGATVNFNGKVTIKAGNYGNFCYLGGACSGTWTGGTANVITGTPTIGTFLQLSGSGSNFAFAPGSTFTGAVAAGGAKYLVSLNASLSLSGVTLPGSVAGSATAGGQVI